MTREELLGQIVLREELIAIDRPNRPGVAIKPSKITIHNTSNASSGADANAHSRFVRNTGFYMIKDSAGNEKKNWVSWHFSVDDRIAIRHLPSNEKAIHAGQEANATSIAIEICMQAGIDQDAADERAAQLSALLCFDLGIPVSGVVPHKHWTGKNCPVLLLSSWNAFVQKISAYLDDLNKAEALVKSNETGLSMGFIQSDEQLCWTDASVAAAMASPFIAAISEVQQGFSTTFLEAGKVPLPVLKSNDPAREHHAFVHHQNMSIYFNKERKLALYAACNYDKMSLIDMNRSNSFRTDDNLDEEFQLGEGFYKSSTLDINASQNFFDRGHLIARRYNQWGETAEEARAGERDTYVFTNIHPQVKELNQQEWEDLEAFIIEQDKLDVKKVSVIAGAIMQSTDPVATYIDHFTEEEATIQVPEVFWKVVFYEVDGELRKIAFLMSQRNRLHEIEFVNFSPALAADPFDKLNKPLKTYIIKSTLIEQFTGLKFKQAIENYDTEEPLEVVIIDNDTHPLAAVAGINRLEQFI